MGDLQPDGRLPGDAQRLGNRLEDLGLLVAHVGGVEAAGRGRHPAERDELIGLGEAPGRIFEPGRQPQRPAGHGLGDEGLHPLELFGRGRPVVVAHGRGPHGPVTDEGGVVQGRSRLLDAAQKAPGVPPVELEPVFLRQVRPHLLESLLGDRERRAAALAADERGHPLADGALGPGIDEKTDVGVVVDVDEAGRDGQTVGDDPGPGPRLGDLADEPDRAVDDADVRPDGRPSRAVVDRAARDEQVEVLALGATLEDEAGAAGGGHGRRLQRPPDEGPPVHAVHVSRIIFKSRSRVNTPAPLRRARPGTPAARPFAFPGRFW